MYKESYADILKKRIEEHECKYSQSNTPQEDTALPADWVECLFYKLVWGIEKH